MATNPKQSQRREPHVARLITNSDEKKGLKSRSPSYLEPHSKSPHDTSQSPIRKKTESLGDLEEASFPRSHGLPLSSNIPDHGSGFYKFSFLKVEKDSNMTKSNPNVVSYASGPSRIHRGSTITQLSHVIDTWNQEPRSVHTLEDIEKLDISPEIPSSVVDYGSVNSHNKQIRPSIYRDSVLSKFAVSSQGSILYKKSGSIIRPFDHQESNQRGSQSRSPKSRRARKNSSILESSKAFINKFKQHFQQIEPASPGKGNRFDLIEDKAFCRVNTMKHAKDRSDQGEQIPKLTKLLRKHAMTGIQRGPSMLFNVIAQLKQNKKKRFINIITGVVRFVSGWFHQLKFSKVKAWKQQMLTPFRPDKFFRVFWDFVILFFVISELVVIPFQYIFDDDYIGGGFENVATVIFLLDLLINFNTAYYFEGALVLKRKQIVRNYLRGWFAFDLFLAFPFRWILLARYSSDDFTENQIENVLRYLSFLRMFRVIRLKKISEKFQSMFDIDSPFVHGIRNLVELWVVICLIAHWCACAWYLITNSFDDPDWVEEKGLVGSGIKDRYIMSIYFIFTTMLTVGFGDISPKSSEERIYIIFVMLLGGCVFGYVMNYIAVIIYSLEDEKAKFKKKVSSLSRYMSKENLSKETQNDIKKYLEFIFESEKSVRQVDRDMIGMLSQDLKGRMYEELNGKYLYGSKALYNNFTKKLLYQIASRIEEKTFVSEEKIFDASDVENCLYFISKGQVQLYLPKAKHPAATLIKGNSFGELEFFNGLSRYTMARSVDFSHLLYLRRESFMEALAEFPHDREMFCMIKDQIILYKQYSVLCINCLGCHESDHGLFSCPKLNFLPDVEKVVKDYLKEQEKFKAEFVRMDRKRFHARTDLYEMNSIATKLIEKYPSKIRDIEEKNESEHTSDSDDDSDDEEEESQEQTNRRQKSKYIKEMTSLIKNVRKSIMIAPPFSKGSVHLKNRHAAKLEDFIRAQAEKFEEAQLSKKSLDMTRKQETLVWNDNPPKDDFEFDKVMNFQIYFPYNNLNKVVDKNQKKKHSGFIPGEDIKNLKAHLRSFFKAFDKVSKTKTKNSLKSSRSRISFKSDDRKMSTK